MTRKDVHLIKWLRVNISHMLRILSRPSRFGEGHNYNVKLCFRYDPSTIVFSAVVRIFVCRELCYCSDGRSGRRTKED